MMVRESHGRDELNQKRMREKKKSKMQKEVKPRMTIRKKKGENTILILIFWGYSQFGPYILVAINLVPAIFNLQLIQFLSLTY